MANKISDETIEYVGILAKLELSAEEKEAAKADMDDLFYTIVHTNEGLYMLNTKNQDGDTPWNVAVKNGATGVQKVIRALEKEYEDAKNPDKEDEKTELIPQPTEPEYEEKPTTEATIVGQE